MKKLKRISVLVILCVSLVQFTAMAQDDTDPGDPPPVEDTPIDGGLALLLAAGAVYGVKKYREVNNNKEELSSLAV